MTIDLKELRAAAEAASPEPWEAAGPWFGAPLPKYLTCVGRINEDEMLEGVCVSPFEEDDACFADMNFIAAAKPATVISLLDKLEAAEKDAARLNWLEQNLFNRENIDWVTKKPCTKFNMWVLFSPVGTQGSSRTIIDAAMKEQQNDQNHN